MQIIIVKCFYSLDGWNNKLMCISDTEWKGETDISSDAGLCNGPTQRWGQLEKAGQNIKNICARLRRISGPGARQRHLGFFCLGKGRGGYATILEGWPRGTFNQLPDSNHDELWVSNQNAASQDWVSQKLTGLTRNYNFASVSSVTNSGLIWP